jgi:hypothetical protein
MSRTVRVFLQASQKRPHSLPRTVLSSSPSLSPFVPHSKERLLSIPEATLTSPCGKSHGRASNFPTVQTHFPVMTNVHTARSLPTRQFLVRYVPALRDITRGSTHWLRHCTSIAGHNKGQHSLAKALYQYCGT